MPEVEVEQDVARLQARALGGPEAAHRGEGGGQGVALLGWGGEADAEHGLDQGRCDGGLVRGLGALEAREAAHEPGVAARARDGRG